MRRISNEIKAAKIAKPTLESHDKAMSAIDAKIHLLEEALKQLSIGNVNRIESRTRTVEK